MSRMVRTCWAHGLKFLSLHRTHQTNHSRAWRSFRTPVFSSTDKITDNPAIVGTLTLDDRPVSDYLVYIDHNGNGSADGTAITDRYGNFVYRPQNLPLGLCDTLNTAYWDSNLSVSQLVYSQPTTFQYTYLAAPLLPSIEWLEIAIDDGENKFDRQTTSSLIAGQLSTSAVHAGVQINLTMMAMGPSMEWPSPIRSALSCTVLLALLRARSKSAHG